MGLRASTLGFLGAYSLASAPGQAQEASAEHFDVALHARTSFASARNERAAWLSLTVPFGALATTRVQGRTVAVASEASEAPAAPPAPETPAPLVQLRALAELTRLATLRALSAAGVATDRRRLDSLSSRSRASAALPEVRLRAQRSTDQALRWAPTTDDPYRMTQSDAAGVTLEASATFRLDRLVFSREELVVERLREKQATEHLRLEQRVQQAVQGLFRAREQACAAEPDAPAREQNRLRSLELGVELDALTAGWFLAQAPRFSLQIWGSVDAIWGLCGSAEDAPTIAVASRGDSE